MSADEPLQQKANGRGFLRVDFRDRCGEECSIQQSSAFVYDDAAPGHSAIWLGCNRDQRMHLDREQVEQLRDMLSRWLETGSFLP